MELVFTKPFIKKYKKLDGQSQKVITKALKTLEDNYKHPSLRVKKMKGYHNPDIWEASANMDLRITFEVQKPDALILRNCGHHDRTLNNP